MNFEYVHWFQRQIHISFSVVRCGDDTSLSQVWLHAAYSRTFDPSAPKNCKPRCFSAVWVFVVRSCKQAHHISYLFLNVDRLHGSHPSNLAPSMQQHFVMFNYLLGLHVYHNGSFNGALTTLPVAWYIQILWMMRIFFWTTSSATFFRGEKMPRQNKRR